MKTMKPEESKSPNRQTAAIVILAAVLVFLVGGIIGFLAGGGGQQPSDTPAVPSPTTTIPALLLTPTTVPSTATTVQEEPPGEELIVAASEDTIVDSDDPDQGFGAVQVLEVEQDGIDRRWALVRFSITEIPEDRPIQQVTLRLLQLGASEQSGLVSLVAGPWNESETTWATAPPLGSPVAPLPGGVEGVQIEIDVTSVVTGNGQFDFYLTTSSDDGLDYASREHGPTGPTLAITLGEPGVSGGAPPTATILVGAGDIASCSSQGDEATAALIEEVFLDAREGIVFTTGDNAYESGSEADFDRCYDPSWGQYREITRPSAGTREYRTQGASGYFGYFGANAGDPGRGYYSYDLGGWHVVVLNSNCEQVGGCDEGSSQEAWLREDLASRSTSCTLAYWQQPLFSSAVVASSLEVLPLFRALYEEGAEVVINGSDHFYERFAPQDPDGARDVDDGIRQFIVGTGGRSLHSFGEPALNSEVRFNRAFGVLAVTLVPGGYQWEFVTEPGSEFTDLGSGACH